jgi:murein biosynthesis integral membrane protein MurJ
LENRLAAVWTIIKPQLFGLVGTVTMINAAVAVLAFFKDLLLATALGTSVHADSLSIAYFLPDTIGNNLLAASLATACVPVFSKLFASRQTDRLWRCVRGIVLISGLICLLLTVALMWRVDAVAGLIAGETSSPLAHSSVRLLLIMLPMIAMSPFLYVGFALLQSLGRFAMPAGSWVVLHVVVIAAAVMCMGTGAAKESSVTAIAAAITFGTFAMTAAVWIHIYRISAFRFLGGQSGSKESELLDIFRVFWPYLLILFASQSVYFFERKLASGFEPGTVAGLNYAFRLSQFPLWVFVAAVSAVVLPSMSKDIAMGRMTEIQRTFRKALKALAIVTVPTTFIFFKLGIPIVSVLFQRGAFNEHSVAITSHILQGYSLTMVGAAVSMIALRYFLAAERPYVPLLIGFVSSAVNVAADYALAPILSSAGIGYGAAIGASLNALLMLAALKKELELDISRMLRASLKLLSANLLPLALVWISSEGWDWLPHDLGFVMKAGYLGIVLALCALVYYWGLKKTKLLSNGEEV